MTSPDVLIVGGGIAGIAAALRLAEQNVRVTLLETRRKLGGRATSFVDVRTGQMLDNCQHVTLGCCVNYLDFLGRLGALDLLEWHDEQYWIERGGRTSIIRPGWLPAPLHFTGAMLGASFLSLGDIAQLARIGGAMLRTDRTRHTGETFGAYLRGHGQSERLIRRFWSPVVVSACNLDVDKVAASSALHVFQDGFFAHAKAASIGLSRVPLVQLYDRAESAIAAAGGTIRLSCGVDRIGPASVVTSAGETLRAGAVICALPVERAREVIDVMMQQQVAPARSILGLQMAQRIDRDAMVVRPAAACKNDCIQKRHRRPLCPKHECEVKECGALVSGGLIPPPVSGRLARRIADQTPILTKDAHQPLMPLLDGAHGPVFDAGDIARQRMDRRVRRIEEHLALVRVRFVSASRVLRIGDQRQIAEQVRRFQAHRFVRKVRIPIRSAGLRASCCGTEAACHWLRARTPRDSGDRTVEVCGLQLGRTFQGAGDPRRRRTSSSEVQRTTARGTGKRQVSGPADIRRPNFSDSSQS